MYFHWNTLGDAMRTLSLRSSLLFYTFYIYLPTKAHREVHTSLYKCTYIVNLYKTLSLSRVYLYVSDRIDKYEIEYRRYGDALALQYTFSNGFDIFREHLMYIYEKYKLYNNILYMFSYKQRSVFAVHLAMRYNNSYT